VEVVPVVEAPLDTNVRLQGELTAFESVALFSRVQAYVDDVPVDRGSVVKKGQLLVRLSAPELVAQRDEAESQARVEESTYESLKGAAATPGVVAGHDLAVARARYAAARAHAESLRALAAYLDLTAPFDGIVTERGVHPGAYVGPASGGGTPLLKMEHVRTLRLAVAVPEADVGAISASLRPEFLVSAWPAERFSGRIARIAHSVEARTRTMAVELDVDNEQGKLAPGMFADVFWPVRRAEPSLWVPASAVVQTSDRVYVDRIKEGVLEQVPVRRGNPSGNLVEVVGPLAKGDLVMARGSEELRNGAKVEAVPAANARGDATKK
jgi:RND family efflux transporter MFP subunit